MSTEHPRVKVGQIWKDNDPRQNTRTVTILEVHPGYAVVSSSTSARRTRVSLTRFKPVQTGYRLIKEA
jgi:hypothetical protein